jgi:hypothetical protein
MTLLPFLLTGFLLCASAFGQPVLLVLGTGGSGGAGGGTCTPASGYAHCRVLTIDHTQVGGSTLTNFPVLVTLALGPGKLANASCFDVVLTSDSGGAIKIPWEQESGLCNSATGDFAAHVLIASLSASSDTSVYASYGNSGVTTAQNTGGNGPTHVWDSNFGPVYHLGPSLSLADSTIGGVTGINSNATSGTGELDGGAVFNGANAQLSGHQWSAYGSFSVSTWVNFTSPATPYQYFVNASGALTFLIAYNYGGNGRISEYLITSAGNNNNLAAGGTAVISTGAWYHIAATYDGTTLITYVNGVQDAVLPITGTVTTSPADPERIGGNATQAIFGICTMDEYRFSSSARSPGWVLAEYNSQRPSATFVTIGGER